ncbi:uncharacterized protein LOC132039870 isoform X2 [Lycium ferocissimum]|uniref:uncharacterized protein LOC132039870 isoform X2 n=1 Tax=Lycium ferocissimum TaxID=112874 RepID=UPI002815F3EA|nr:uncharacterized protein LOC132039870 isoform X2 [Lycium ferocissimum]
MGFCHNQESTNHSKRFKFLVSTLKNAFANCYSFRKRRQSCPEKDDPIYYYDDEDEAFISVVISQYMELKCRRKTTITTDKFTWAFSPTTGDLFISAKLRQKKEENEDQEKEEREDFYSVASRLSPCSSATSFEDFVTAKTIFSSSSSLDRIDFQGPWRHSVIQELSHCEGWPFGLYRKSLLLPPLPKSPSDSWSWSKSARMVKMQ